MPHLYACIGPDLAEDGWPFQSGLAVTPLCRDSLKQRPQQFALDVLEAEGLDRIRNPSRYLGK